MPSFDIVSEIDMHELTNVVDQANREITTRFDFKGSNATFEVKENTVVMTAPNDFQLKQMLDILTQKMGKRSLDVKCMQPQEIQVALHEAKQIINIVTGIDKERAKKMVKMIKDSKLKVQVAIQGEQLRVTGKKRDDLQSVMAHMREAKDIDVPLQYVNFRD